MTKEEFIKEVTDGLLPPPAYFPLNVKLNKEGYESIDTVLKNSAQPLSVKEFELLANESGAIILDVRHQTEFVKGFIPQSIFIGIDGGFAPWVGALIKDILQPILLVAPVGQEKEVITRLSRVGFDNVLGFLEGGFTSWENSGKETDRIVSVLPSTLENKNIEKLQIFDVRKPSEFSSERIPTAINTPLNFINEHINEFPEKETFYVYCGGGYRSVIASSILKARGFHNMIDLAGGFAAIRKSNLPKNR